MVGVFSLSAGGGGIMPCEWKTREVRVMAADFLGRPEK